MKKKLALLFAALCLLLALTGCGEKEQSVHVTLYNQSGHDITSVCITPASSDDWGENFLDETLADGTGVTIGLGTYKESEVPSAYNILVYNDENYILYDTSVDELDFAIQDGDYIIFLPPEGEVPIGRAVLLRHQRGLRVDRHQPLRRAGRPRLRRGRGREHHALHGG